MQAANIIEVTEANINQLMTEESTRKLVMLDFWADWCAPCKALIPVLEKLAAEYSEQLVLAKVNVDQQQAISAQFGVRSLPTVALVKDGQLVDGFQGAQPESFIRERLQAHLPAPWQAHLDQAQNLMAEGEHAAALTELRAAYAQSQESFAVGLLLADCLLQLKRGKDALAILQQATLEEQLQPAYKELMSRVELMLEAAETPEIRQLQERLAQAPDDLELKYELAVQFSQADRIEQALDLMLAVLQQDRGFKEGAARKTMIDMLNGLGKGDPLAARYQRKLFTLLY